MVDTVSLRVSVAADASVEVGQVDVQGLLARHGVDRADAFLLTTFTTDTQQEQQGASPDTTVQSKEQSGSLLAPPAAHFLTAPKDARLGPSLIEVLGVRPAPPPRQGQGGAAPLVVSLRASTTSLYVMIEAEGIAGRFSDNGQSLPQALATGLLRVSQWLVVLPPV